MRMLIWRNIARRRSQSLLTIAITLLTILVFTLVLAVYLVTGRGLALSRERLGADAMLIPRYAVADASDLLFTAIPENIYMPATVLEEAKKLRGIAAMSPQFFAQSLSLSCCDTGEEARIIGFDPESDFILRPYLDQENADGLKEDELIMGANFEDKDLLGYQYLLLGRKCRVAHLLEPTGSGMDSTIFLNIDSVRRMCLESLVLSEDWKDRDPFASISVIMIKLEEGTDPQAFARQVEQSGIDAKCLLTGETISNLQTQLEMIMNILFVLWFTSLLIAGLALLGRFNALAKERKKEIGLLRALGMKKRQIFALIIGETCSLALLGGVIGSGLALLASGSVIDTLKDVFRLSPSVWSPALALFCTACGVLLSLGLGFAAALVPAAQSAALDPQVAISRGELN